MLHGAFSLDCFHCVDVRTVNRTSELRTFLQGVPGSICPLCRTPCTTWLMVCDQQEFDDRMAEADGWIVDGDETGPTTPTGPPPGASPAAKALRAQVSAAAAERHRRLCRSATDVLQAGTTFDVGQQAWKEGRIDDARRALTVCAGTRSDEASRAALILGDMADKAKKPAEAARWFEKATAAADVEVRSAAHFLLAAMQERSGDRRAAERHYQQCLDAGRSQQSGKASRHLGDLRIERGDLAGAIDAYRPGLDAGDPETAARIAVNLAWVYEETGDWPAAVGLWELAYRRSAGEARLVAAFNLGRVWDRRHVRPRARHYYRIALAAKEPGVADRARAALGP
jgi:tetratricopeptide (TPR) repeat protein